MKYSITDKDLKGMKCLGSGNFGTVYTDGINVIKVWHKFCKTEDLSLVKNPCYRMDRANSRRFRRLNKKSNSLIFSDVGVEEVYLNHSYAGVKKKYYDGLTLDNLLYLSLEEKKSILLKLIRNIEELINNNIYSLDCKLDNVMVTKDGEVKIVDLDDVFTKVSTIANPFYKRKCLLGLKKTIIHFLYYNQFQFYTSSLEVIDNSSIAGRVRRPSPPGP